MVGKKSESNPLVDAVRKRNLICIFSTNDIHFIDTAPECFDGHKTAPSKTAAFGTIGYETTMGDAAHRAEETIPADAPSESAPEPTAGSAAADTSRAKTDQSPAEPGTPIAQLWNVAKTAGHPEIWAVTLADPGDHVPTRVILQKYLNANDGDLAKAKDQLLKTLEWRAKTKPLDLAKKLFSKAKFDRLGYVTTCVQEGSAEPEGKEVFTWNIYGGVKSMEETFGNLEE